MVQSGCHVKYNLSSKLATLSKVVIKKKSGQSEEKKILTGKWKSYKFTKKKLSKFDLKKNITKIYKLQKKQVGIVMPVV